jgi:hypothetical protein
MIACYERVESGDRLLGNMHVKRNRLLRQTLEGFLHRRREIEHTMRVEQEMGVGFTLANMLHLHRELRAWHSTRDAANQDLSSAQRSLGDALVCLNLVVSMVEHRSFNADWTDAVEHGRIVTLRFARLPRAAPPPPDGADLVRYSRQRVDTPPPEGTRVPPPGGSPVPPPPPDVDMRDAPSTPRYESPSTVFDPNLRFEQPQPGNPEHQRSERVVDRLNEAVRDIRHARTMVLRAVASSETDPQRQAPWSWQSDGYGL